MSIDVVASLPLGFAISFAGEAVGVGWLDLPDKGPGVWGFGWLP